MGKEYILKERINNIIEIEENNELEESINNEEEYYEIEFINNELIIKQK
jgi:hypothetical protein